jgi:precorrin-8X/cobalt-precorrin-8 methylmutase
MEYIKDPQEIERLSFEMIDGIVLEECGGYPSENRLYQAILRRVIHTSADFDYVENLYFSEDVLQRLETAFDEPLIIYTDTNMALSGINKTALKSLNAEVKCYVADEITAQMAKERQMTRSMAAVLRAVEEPGRKLFVFGNAPTALYQTMECYETLKDQLVAIIGVPVGFVGAAESKDALKASKISGISALGRKGGSNVAAAIVNAVMYNKLKKYE